MESSTTARRLEQLAELLLDCPWSQSAHETLLRRLFPKDSNAPAELAGRLHGQFTGVVSRNKLIQFLEAQKRLWRGLRWKRIDVVQQKRWLIPTKMQPGLADNHSWDIPTIHSTTELASHWLQIPFGVLVWLCDSRFAHYRTSTIRKRAGLSHRGVTGRTNYRILEQPKMQLKSVQRKILSDILAKIPTHPSAHGFVQGRSVVSFTAPHAGRDVVLRMDLQDFFASIRATRIYGLFRSLGYPFNVANALCKLCTTFSDIDQLPELQDVPLAKRLELRSLYGSLHLPQGAPTSPTLSNLIAYRLDARLTGLANSIGLTYTRYADDLLFSGDRRLQRCSSSFVVQVAAVAMEEGFQVQFRKTRVLTKSGRQEVAGVVINQHPNISRPSYDKLKAILHNCLQNGPVAENREQHPDFRSHLLGKISWIQQLNPVRGNRLLAMFQKIPWDLPPGEIVS